jgi:hypothetical protein
MGGGGSKLRGVYGVDARNAVRARGTAYELLLGVCGSGCICGDYSAKSRHKEINMENNQ